MNDTSVSYIAQLLAERTGQRLSESRLWRINTALSGIFRERGIANLDQLVTLLDNPAEVLLARKVVEALLNNETYFFRDPAYFDLLSGHVLPRLAEKQEGRKRLSIWSAGCSTGQEVFSLAMLFAEQASLWADWTIEILGTDISCQAIETARRGAYSQFEIQRGLSVNRMLLFFEDRGSNWRTSDDMSRMVHFRQHNILDLPPSGAPFDLILCRNVLLYFDDEVRQRAFNRIADAIHGNGWLMLGAGETVVGQTDLFRPEAGANGLFRPLIARNASCENALTDYPKQNIVSI